MLVSAGWLACLSMCMCVCMDVQACCSYSILSSLFRLSPLNVVVLFTQFRYSCFTQYIRCRKHAHALVHSLTDWLLVDVFSCAFFSISFSHTQPHSKCALVHSFASANSRSFACSFTHLFAFFPICALWLHYSHTTSSMCSVGYFECTVSHLTRHRCCADWIAFVEAIKKNIIIYIDDTSLCIHTYIQCLQCKATDKRKIVTVSGCL